jgi:6-phosphogluconolactonase
MQVRFERGVASRLGSNALEAVSVYVVRKMPDEAFPIRILTMDRPRPKQSRIRSRSDWYSGPIVIRTHTKSDSNGSKDLKTHQLSSDLTGDELLKPLLRAVYSTIAIVAPLFSASHVAAQTRALQLAPGPDGPRQRAEFAFAANQNSNNLSTYLIGADGALTALPGSPVLTGTSPNAVAVDPAGKFVYVANVLSDNVSAYRIATDGTLSPVLGSPYPAGSGTVSVTIDPTGRFLYVPSCGADCSGTGAGSVSAYTINRATGALTPVVGSPFSSGQFPYCVAVDFTGRFAYVANFGSGTVSAFRIHGTSGALTPVKGSPFLAGSSPISVVVEPWNQFLYVSNTASNNISAYAMQPDGSLKPVSGSPFSTGPFTSAVTSDASGRYVYLAGGAGVFGFAIYSSGALAPLSGSPFAAGGFTNSVSVDPSNHFLYASDPFSGVYAFHFDDETGYLSLLTGSPFPAGANTVSVTTTSKQRVW